MSELLTRRRFTIEEYHRMGEAGILTEDNRLELIAGDIVVREPIGAYHAGTVEPLRQRAGPRARRAPVPSRVPGCLARCGRDRRLTQDERRHLGRHRCLTVTGGSRMTLESVTMGKLLTRRRFTVDEYHRMGETGIVAEDDRIELIYGDIVVREPIGAYHASVVNRLTRLLMSRLGDRAIVSVQNPVQFPQQDTELQPDVTLLRSHDDFYATRHPQAAEVLLLIEVADTTLRLDRRVKIPLYARVGVREVWLVDLTTARLEVHRGPLGERYGGVRVLGRGERVSPDAFPDVSLDVAEIVG